MKFPRTTANFLWHFAKKQRLGYSILFFTAAFWAINESFYPYFIKQIVNRLAQFDGPRTQVILSLSTPMIFLASFWLIMEICMRMQGMTTMNVFPRFRANIRQAIYRYTSQHSHQFFLNQFAGSIANKIQDLPSSSERLMEIIVFNGISLTTLITSAVVLMWHANPIFACIMLTWVLLHLSIIMLSLRKGAHYSEQHAESVTTLTGKIVDSITNIQNVRLFARTPYESDYLKYYQEQELSKAKRYNWHIEKMKIFLGLASLAFMSSLVFTLIYGWMHHWVSLGDFTLINMLAFSILGFMWYMSYQLTIFIKEWGKITAALQILATEHDMQDAPQATKLNVSAGRITFDKVTFSYGPSVSVFNELSLQIQPGEKVGLVGFSGSGKSTFVNLILRFYLLNSGKISIDDQDITQVTARSLREQIAMIPQDPSLFHRSLLDNIRYGNTEASDEEVIAAAKIAHCDEFIRDLPEGYHTLVGERGVKLSGGQRQRIAIARCALKAAPILILDEATSALDTVTEKFIQSSLEKLMQDRTTLVIAHRLSTLANMDRILVFDQGRLVEDGSVQELLQGEGHFAKLWQLQQHGLLPKSESEPH